MLRKNVPVNLLNLTKKTLLKQYFYGAIIIIILHKVLRTRDNLVNVTNKEKYEDIPRERVELTVRIFCLQIASFFHNHI